VNDLLALRVVGGLALALLVTQLARRVVRPAPRLASRVTPYVTASRSSRSHRSDRDAIGATATTPADGSPLVLRLCRPVIESIAQSITKLLGATLDDETLALRLRQAGVMLDLPDHERVHEFRVRQVGAALGWGTGLATVAALSGRTAAAALALFLAGTLVGATRRGSRVSRRIEQRRTRMRVELYTVNQLLAIYLRTSGSPVMAAQRLVSRGRGAVIDELAEALRLHARGMGASKAFSRIAEQTPEPFAARTYKLLASGSDRGADLATALLSLSEDVRDFRRTTLRRSATRRQAAMLVPIIFFLAPVMLLFLAAPLPSLVTHAAP
jgi:tight adherence protein C